MRANPERAWAAGGDDPEVEERNGYRTKVSKVSATVDAWVRKVAQAH